MARPELDRLLNAVLPFAQELLAKHHEFYPFGASIDSNGEISQVNASVGKENPHSQEVLDSLVAAFRERALRDRLRAAAICLDVRTIPPGSSEKTDAISVRLEHADGEAIEVLLPYERDGLARYRYGTLFAIKGECSIFGTNGGAV
jgi:hypothetical protein